MMHVLFLIPFFMTLAWTIYLARARKLRSMAHLMFLIFTMCCTIMFFTHSATLFSETFGLRLLSDDLDAFNCLSILPCLYLFLKESKKIYINQATQETINFRSFLRCVGWRRSLLFLPSLFLGVAISCIYIWIAIGDPSMFGLKLKEGEFISQVIDSPYQSVYSFVNIIGQVIMILQLFCVVAYTIWTYMRMHIENSEKTKIGLFTYIFPSERDLEKSNISYAPQTIDKIAWSLVLLLVVMSITLLFQDAPAIEIIKLFFLLADVWAICYIISRYGVLVQNPKDRESHS